MAKDQRADRTRECVEAAREARKQAVGLARDMRQVRNQVKAVRTVSAAGRPGVAGGRS